MSINTGRQLPYYEIHGQRYPRVTSVLKAIANPGLDDWKTEQVVKAAALDIASYAEGGIDNDEQVLAYVQSRLGEWREQSRRDVDQAARFGTVGHHFVEHLHKGTFSDELFWSEMQAYPDLDAETMLSLLHQYRDEFLASGIHPILCEQLVYHARNGRNDYQSYAGKLDLWAYADEGALITRGVRKEYLAYPALLNADVKFSKGYYDTYGAQLAAYRVALGPTPLLSYENGLTLWAKEHEREIENTLGFCEEWVTVRLDPTTNKMYVKRWPQGPATDLWAGALKVWWAQNAGQLAKGE